MRFIFAAVLAAMFAVTLLGGAAHATGLTFDLGPTGVLAMDQNYGDRVTSLVMGSFSYSGTGGFTQNVVVDYFPNDGGLTRWDNDYGDLTNILEYEPDGNGPYDIVFTADSGYAVTLQSFDLAGYPNADYTLPSFQVLSGNTVLYTQNNVLVQGDFDGPRHTSIDFGTGFTASTLTLRINQQTLGGDSDNIGLDNLVFSQSIVTADTPEPTAGALVATGLFCAAFMGAAQQRRLRSQPALLKSLIVNGNLTKHAGMAQ